MTIQGSSFLLLHPGVQGTRPATSEGAAVCVDWAASKPSLSSFTPGLACLFIREALYQTPSWGGHLALSFSRDLTCSWKRLPLNRTSFFYLLGSEPFLKILFIIEVMHASNRLKQYKAMLQKGWYVCMYVCTTLYNIYMYIYIYVSSQTAVTTHIWLLFNKNEIICNAICLFCRHKL